MSEIALEVRSALEWWQLSGVDCDFSDDATAWLESEREEDPVRPGTESGSTKPDLPAGPGDTVHATRDDLRETKTPPRDLFHGDKPADLEQFHRWWLEAPGIDAIGPRGRIAPRGSANAELMVLVLDPEAEDRDTLLGGPQGRLFANMLSAMRLPADRVYIASALPRHTPMADTPALAHDGMADVVAHHITLASPQRLLVIGTDILPLLGLDATEPDRYFRGSDAKWQAIPMMVCEGLDAMMAMPTLKARFWKRWIEWSQRT